MPLNMGGRIKTFFSHVGSYAKENPWKTAAIVTVGVLGLLLIAGGIVLTATAPASFGGGAAVGVPLLGAGTALAAGFVVIAAGVVTTGCATGYLWTSAKKQARRKQATKRMDNLQSILKETSQQPHASEEVKPKTEKQAALKKQVNFAVVPAILEPDRSSRTSLWRRPVNDKKRKVPTSGEDDGDSERDKRRPH